MKVSRKTDYALRALFALIEKRGDGPIPTQQLAGDNDIPKKFLEHILLDLKAQGWVASLPGKAGGYLLAVHPNQITMGQVVRLFDTQLAPINCVSTTNYEACSQEAKCRFRRVFLNVRNLTAQIMDRLTLARVFEGDPVRQEELRSDAVWGGMGI